MRIAWLNNSPSPTGGTLQATHSMISALPDCEHSVYLPKGLHPGLLELFGESVDILFGADASKTTADLVVCQNTPASGVPRCSARVVYYAHSAHSGLGRLPAWVDSRLCVSRWLADKVGWDDSTVLYQPVTIPPKNGSRSPDRITIGRICTPTHKKWVLDEWLPYFMEARRALPEARISLVGVPKSVRGVVPQDLQAEFLEASVDARSRLHEWDILLYTSSVEESFGRVVREAQRCGCFPVVSDLGGFQEQIDVTPSTEWGPGHLIRSPSEVPEVLRKWMDSRTHLENLCIKWGDRSGSLQVWRDGFLKVLGEL